MAEKKLQGKVALITGASAGTGKAIALLFAEHGCDVVIMARRQKELEEVATGCRKHGVRAITCVGDVSKEEDVSRCFEILNREFDGLDILVNNAGVGKFGPIDVYSVADYDWMMNTNMRSTFLCTRLAVPLLKKRNGGHIINIASVAGTKGLPNESVYCATKWAQVGFSYSLDHELRQHNIKVSAICPGGIDTEFAFGTGRTPGEPRLKQMLDAETVAETVLFVATQPPKSRILQVIMRPMNEPH